MANIGFFTVCVKSDDKKTGELIAKTTQCYEILSLKTKKSRNKYICIFTGESKNGLDAYTSNDISIRKFKYEKPDEETLRSMGLKLKSKLFKAEIEYWEGDFTDSDYCTHTIYKNGKVLLDENLDLSETEGAEISEDRTSANFVDLLYLPSNKKINPPAVKLEDFVCKPEDYEIKGKKLIEYKGDDKYIILPEGIEVIGKNAFSNQEGQTQIIRIPEGLKRVEEMAFDSCWSVREVFFPKSLEKIEEYGFNFFEKLLIHIPETCIYDEDKITFCSSFTVDRYKI